MNDFKLHDFACVKINILLVVKGRASAQSVVATSFYAAKDVEREELEGTTCKKFFNSVIVY